MFLIVSYLRLLLQFGQHLAAKPLTPCTLRLRESPMSSCNFCRFAVDFCSCDGRGVMGVLVMQWVGKQLNLVGASSARRAIFDLHAFWGVCPLIRWC